MSDNFNLYKGIYKPIDWNSKEIIEQQKYLCGNNTLHEALRNRTVIEKTIHRAETNIES